MVLLQQSIRDIKTTMTNSLIFSLVGHLLMRPMDLSNVLFCMSHLCGMSVFLH